MEVKTILLCESATPHPDGTFSLLRGGIDNWNIPNFPASINFSYVMILELMSTEVGRTHAAEMDAIDADGNRVMPQAKIPFSIPVRVNVTKYKFNIVGGMNIVIARPGKYSLNISVDGHHLSSTDFQVVQAAQQIQQG